MGTVYAKDINVESKMSAVPLKIDLSTVKARVDKVHVDGVARTKNDILHRAVKDLFEAKDFNQVMSRAKYVKKQLESLGAFSKVDFFIDVSKGASPEGLEVTYYVVESSRITGGIHTLVGNNEGTLVIGTKASNLFGRGESLQSEYQYGTKKSTGFNVTLTKPLLGWANPRVTAAAFQQGADFVWSGFREVDRGTLAEVLFQTSPYVCHNIRWEGIWRELKCLTPASAFAIREEMGHSMKSSLKHIMTVENRDNPILPNWGSFFKLSQEYAGLGGSVGFLKHEVQYQVNHSLFENVVLQATVTGGLLRSAGKNKSYGIADKFFLGGPLTLRGFSIRGVGPHSEDNALGSESYWVAGLHLYTPLPFRPGRGSFDKYVRTHLFLNAGNIGRFSFSDDYYQSLVALLTDLRFTYGAGIVLSLGHVARFELNYCIPVKLQQGDKSNSGLQFGIGVSFV